MGIGVLRGYCAYCFTGFPFSNLPVVASHVEAVNFLLA